MGEGDENDGDDGEAGEAGEAGEVLGLVEVRFDPCILGRRSEGRMSFMEGSPLLWTRWTCVGKQSTAMEKSASWNKRQFSVRMVLPTTHIISPLSCIT